MLAQLRDAVIASVRRRVEQGDCPTERAQTVEVLEHVILDLADATPSQRLDAATVERNLEAQRQTIEACARVADRMEGGLNIAGAIRRLSPNDALATEPHQHGGKGA